MEEKIVSDNFSLFPLFAFVAKDPTLPPLLSKKEKKKSTPYKEAVVDLLEKAGVPREAGWYVWGKFNDAGFWEPIYIGKASKGKTSNLFARLQKELQAECVAIFATVYGRYWATAAAKKLFKDKVKKMGGPDFSGNIERSLRKTDTHFIMWARASEGMTPTDISRVENVLISVFRPGFNMRRPRIEGTRYYEDLKVGPYIIALENEIGRIVGEK